MKELHILAVGRLKTSYWREAAEHYVKLLSHTVRVTHAHVKDADAGFAPERRVEEEGRRLQKAAPVGFPLICLDAEGKSFNSPEFAGFLRNLYTLGKPPVFIIGGPYGLAGGLKAQARHCISLSGMTFPHEAARVLLLEQLYRAESILAGTGYHH